ncbi:MAG: ABC transporter ATP-binding protein [Desulfatibacillaceae bacterium]
MSESRNILEIRDLAVDFTTDEGVLSAVDGVSFDVRPNEVLGLVGESGCGKSVTAMSLLRLVPDPPGKIREGTVHLDGTELLGLSPKQLRRVRGAEVSVIFQDPATALSPLHRVGDQLAEVLRIHGRAGKKEAAQQAVEWLRRVGISNPAENASAYPHEMSGGMQQRIVIAMALMMGPRLVIADEPTTALDVTISAQIFDLLRGMREERTSVLLITHDLGVIWEMCQRVLVMYAGKIVEEGLRDDLFDHPSHPYTQGLLRSVPRLTGEKDELYTIEGSVPSPLEYPRGCRFNTRCPHAFDRCFAEEPDLFVYGPHRRVACYLAERWLEARRG